MKIKTKQTAISKSYWKATMILSWEGILFKGAPWIKAEVNIELHLYVSLQ